MIIKESSDILNLLDMWDEKAKSGDIVTITGANGVQMQVQQGLIDIMKEIHGVDLVHEIERGLLPWSKDDDHQV